MWSSHVHTELVGGLGVSKKEPGFGETSLSFSTLQSPKSRFNPRKIPVRTAFSPNPLPRMIQVPKLINYSRFNLGNLCGFLLFFLGGVGGGGWGGGAENYPRKTRTKSPARHFLPGQRLRV